MDADSRQDLTFIADAVVIDFAANAIRLRVPELVTEPEATLDATLDVGANGRLVGLEVGEAYIQVMGQPDAHDPHLRSADVRISISGDSPPYVSIPRRGATYEITYPSGNECWQMKSVGGELIQVCATIEAAPGALTDVYERRTNVARRQTGSAPE
jgi:hypothetical protein